MDMSTKYQTGMCEGEDDDLYLGGKLSFVWIFPWKKEADF